LTAGENIADTMGLEAAFKAYKRRERECGKSDIVLPGHEDVTNDQLFFLSFATVSIMTDREFRIVIIKLMRIIMIKVTFYVL